MCYWVGDLEKNHSKLVDLCQSVLQEEFFLCFINESHFTQEGASYLKDLDPESPVTFITSTELKEHVLEAAGKRKSDWLMV